MSDFAASLKGRVAVVTGAGQGIGRHLARRFAEAGAVPVIAEINAAKGKAVAAEIGGNRSLFVETDAADEASLAAMAKTVTDRFGRLDILVNNAAIFSTLEMRPFWQIPVAEWRRVMDVNATGPFLAARAVLPAMLAAQWGRIVNVSSAAVTMGRPNYLHYIASKSALIGMSRSMARELGAFGINVNAVMPGATFTEIERKTVTPQQKIGLIAQQSLKREAVPDDIAGVILFLCSDAAKWVTGQCLTADGGGVHT
jgi:3-oxoacyl-[acyl-carrier protein] reductase